MEAIKRMKFWIGLGLLVVASGVVLGVWFVPARKKSASFLSDWRSKETKIRAYEGMSDVRGPADVTALKELQQRYQQQLEEAKELLAEWDKLLEDYIPDEDGSRRQLDGAAWKVAYAARVDALEEDAQESFPSAPASIVVQRDFGRAWPTPEEMRQEAKRYWVQFYLLEAISAVNKVSDVVPTLKVFQLVERPDRLLGADDASMFQPIPFEFQFATEFKNLPMVLHKLLQCRVPVSVTTLSVKRRGKVSLGVQKKAMTTGGLLSASAVSSLVASTTAGARGAAARRPIGPTWERPSFLDAHAMGGPSDEAVSRTIDTGAGRFGGRTSGGARTTAGSRKPAPSVRRSPAEVEAGRLLVDVTLKGYVKDYVPPKEAEPADDDAAQE